MRDSDVQPLYCLKPYTQFVTCFSVGCDAAALGRLRRTGISLARGDGALKEILRWGTHAPDRDVMSLYTSIEWEKLCAEVAKLKIGLTRGTVLLLQNRGSLQ